MSTLLLIVIYAAFIGLGIPDSLLGSAWPAIYTELNLPVSYANFITMIISGGTIISSLFSASLIHRFGTANITAISTTITALALFGFSCSNNMLWLCLFAIPLGLGAGAIDTALNNYVALHYKATHMNFLHCFYGIGVSLSPFLMSLVLSHDTWRNGYRLMFWFQSGIALLTIVSLPIWKKVKHSSENSKEENSKLISFFTLFRKSKVRIACLVFIGSCGLEYTCGIWGSTFLVKIKEMSPDTAALMITFYYVGMALGRFFSGIFAVRFTSRQLIKIGQTITLTAIILLLLPLPSVLSGFELFLIGFGNGPVFPSMIHQTPQNFGKNISQSVMGIQMAASYIGILLSPALFGLIAQHINIALFPYYLLILYSIMVTGTLLLTKY